MSEGSAVVTTRVDGGVATVTMVRPEAMNALNMELKQALAQTFSQVADDPAVRCVVLTGSGRAFSAGGDIGEMALNDAPVRSRARLEVLLRDTISPLVHMEKPTIAAVNGPAFGAGLSLALACDFVVAQTDAVLSCAFTRLGLVPDCGALHLLPRRVPLAVAKDLVFTGRRLTADQAHELGLVDHVVAGADLEGDVARRAAELAAAPTVALGLAKRLLEQSLASGWSELAQLEALAQAICYSTRDHAAARAAFLDKSTPTFVGA